MGDKMGDKKYKMGDDQIRMGDFPIKKWVIKWVMAG
jgi:hypothetical protein